MRYLALSMFSTSSLLFPEIELTVTFVTCAFVVALPIKSKVAKAKMIFFIILSLSVNLRAKLHFLWHSAKKHSYL